ncbi:MAG: MBL fold metallo-hydrolase [Rhodocyclaceae bacterium]
MQITFLGAAGEVTGSCYLVDTGRVRFLVECGMFQGGRDARQKNLRALNVDLRQIAFVLLSHAHLDHTGLFPRLVALGFRGLAFATTATVDLLGVLLLDSAHIQEKESEWKNRHDRQRHASRGVEAAPLYTVAQAQASLAQLRSVAYETIFSPVDGVRCRMRDAGHILGSAIIELWIESPGGSRKIVFSGDLGQPARPVLRDPTVIDEADVLLVESTYGNRLHKTLAETEDEFVEALTDTLARKGGNVVIPSFAVGRTQELLFIFADLVRRGRLGHLDIIVDSPMSLSATEITLRHPELLDAETHELIAWQRHHPDSPRIRFVQDVEESIALNQRRGGAVIISASGMCDAGRIKYHLLHNLPRRESSIVFCGFQAAGTLGRRLVDGARNVTLFSERVSVLADIYTIGGLSAHADQAALLAWLRGFRKAPQQVFVVHGEAETARVFADTVVQRLGWTGVSVPQYGSTADIG